MICLELRYGLNAAYLEINVPTANPEFLNSSSGNFYVICYGYNNINIKAFVVQYHTSVALGVYNINNKRIRKTDTRAYLT